MRFVPVYVYFWFVVLCAMVLFISSLVHAQSVVISPNGGITYIYPGTHGAPTVIMPPTGLPTYVWPSPASSAPVPTMPIIVVPSPSFDWMK